MYDGSLLDAGAGCLTLALDRAGAFDCAVEPCGVQHLPGKVRALAGHVRHLGVLALIGIGIQINGGAIGHLCPARGYW